MKTDYVRRIDQGHPGNGKRAYGVPTSSGTGLPYSASLTPQPITIPVALETGKLHPGWLPDFAPNSGYGEGSPSGQQIIAPWVYLVAPLPVGATTITVTGNGLAVGDNITLSHASMPNEAAAVVGGPVQVGAVYEYTLSRPNEQHDYPAYTRAYNRGSVSDGGWISVVSGDQSDNLVAPHINLWTYDADGNEERRVRIGRLQGLSAGEKAQFPKVEDWNVYGLYADAAYLRGQIVADSGDIAGDLDVGGTLGVWSGLGRTGVVLGKSEGGHGITLQNEHGRPVFAAIAPYEEDGEIKSDVAVYIDNKGKKGLFYHFDQAAGEYRLEIGVDTLVDGTLTAANILAGTGTYPGAFTGMRFGAEGLQTYGADYREQVSIDVQDGRLYFGRREGWLSEDGITIDARLFPADIDDMEHTITWLHNSAYAPTYIGAAVGSQATGEIFMTTRRLMLDGGTPGAWTTNDFSEARLTLRAFDTSSLAGETVEIYGRLGAAMRAGDYDYATLAPGGRFSTTSLTAGPIHTSDDGQSLLVGTNSATGARLISQSDTVAAFRGQRSDGQYIALTPTAVAESWISASGAIVLAPNIGQPARSVLPATGSVSLGTAARPWGDVFATRLHGTVGSQVAIADNSSMYLTRQTMTLGVNLEAENVIAYALQSDLPVGDFIQFEDVDGNQETIRINTVGAGAGDWYEYEVERAQATGETPLLWYAGTVGVSLGGNATDGYIRLFGTDDLNPATGPSIVIYQRENDDAPESVSERAVFGNLSGWYHYADNADLYGVAFGRKSGAWASMDEANGLRMFWNETQLAQYGEAIDIGQPDAAHLHIDADDVTLYAGPMAMIELLGSGDANITGTLAVATGGALTWAGGKGRADDTGLRITDDANNYAQFFKQPAQYLYVVVDGTTSSTAISGLSTANTGVRGVGGVYGVDGDSTSGWGVYGHTTAGYGVYAAANVAGIALGAFASGGATTALQISGGIVDGGSQRYTAMADATADTDGLNRQTGDGRYLLQTGTATGATSQAQTFNYGIVVNETSNDSDSRFEGNGDANLLFVDAGADRVGIGTGAPGAKLHITNGAAAGVGLKITAAASQSANVIDVVSSADGGMFAVDQIGRLRVGTTAAAAQEVYVTSSRVVSDSAAYPLVYVANTNADGAGHSGVSLSRGSEAAVSSFAFLVAGTNSFEIGDYNNHMFLRDTKGTYVFFARFAHGIPADTIYGASTSMRFNDGGNDYDFVFEGDTEPNLLWTDGSADTVYQGGTTTRLATDKNGDTWWEAAGAGLPFGSVYGNEIGWAQASAAQNTWYAIADTDMTDGQLNLVTHDGSGKLTVAKAGRYLVNYAVSLQCDSVNTHVQTGISVSGTVANDGIQHYEIPNIATLADTQLTISSTAILSLAASATVEIALRTTDAGDPDISVDHLNFTIVQVGG